MRNRILTPTIAVGLALIVLTGCQTYVPRPLNPESHLDAAAARSVEDESLRAFVNALDDQPPTATFDPSDGIDMREGEYIVLFFNPDLRLTRLRASVEYEIAAHSGRWGDPEFSVDAMRITESVPDRWIVASSLSVTVPISGRLSAERQRANASARAALSRIAEEEWATRAKLRSVWLKWSATRLRIARTESLLASVTTLADATDRLAKAGELPATQASLFTIERINLLRRVELLNASLKEQELMIRALMGLAPDAPITLNPSLTLPDELSIPSTDTIIEHHPTLVRLRDEYSIAEATLLYEIRKQYPDITLGPAFESDQGQSRIGLIAGIPLPILNANTEGIARARAQRELARGAYEAYLERVMHELPAATTHRDSARVQRVMYESEIVPLVDQQLRNVQQLLELGESDGLVLLESLALSGRASMELIDARLEEALAIDRILTIIGAPRPQATSSNTNTPQEEVQQ